MMNIQLLNSEQIKARLAIMHLLESAIVETKKLNAQLDEFHGALNTAYVLKKAA